MMFDDANGGDIKLGFSKDVIALRRIAQSLNLPLDVFYGPKTNANCGIDMASLSEDRLLTLIEAHLRRIDPEARRHFGEAVRARAQDI